MIPLISSPMVGSYLERIVDHQIGTWVPNHSTANSDRQVNKSRVSVNLSTTFYRPQDE